MAVVTQQLVVTPSATQLATGNTATDAMPAPVLVRNEGPGELYVGGASVSAGTGFKLVEGQSVALDLYPTDNLWAMSPTWTGVSVLKGNH